MLPDCCSAIVGIHRSRLQELEGSRILTSTVNLKQIQRQSRRSTWIAPRHNLVSGPSIWVGSRTKSSRAPAASSNLSVKRPKHHVSGFNNTCCRSVRNGPIPRDHEQVVARRPFRSVDPCHVRVQNACRYAFFDRPRPKASSLNGIQACRHKQNIRSLVYISCDRPRAMHWTSANRLKSPPPFMSEAEPAERNPCDGLV